MKKSNKFSPEVRERAVRMVQESTHRSGRPSIPSRPRLAACHRDGDADEILDY